MLGRSPDSYRRLVGSDLGSNCLQLFIGGNLFVSRLGRTDLLRKLNARVIAPAGKFKRQIYFSVGPCVEIWAPVCTFW